MKNKSKSKKNPVKLRKSDDDRSKKIYWLAGGGPRQSNTVRLEKDGQTQFEWTKFYQSLETQIFFIFFLLKIKWQCSAVYTPIQDIIPTPALVPPSPYS